MEATLNKTLLIRRANISANGLFISRGTLSIENSDVSLHGSITFDSAQESNTNQIGCINISGRSNLTVLEGVSSLRLRGFGDNTWSINCSPLETNNDLSSVINLVIRNTELNNCIGLDLCSNSSISLLSTDDQIPLWGSLATGETLTIFSSELSSNIHGMIEDLFPDIGYLGIISPRNWDELRIENVTDSDKDIYFSSHLITVSGVTPGSEKTRVLRTTDDLLIRGLLVRDTDEGTIDLLLADSDDHLRGALGVTLHDVVAAGASPYSFQAVTDGPCRIILEPSLDIQKGDELYVSRIAPGYATNVEATVSGEYNAPVGHIIDTLEYDNAYPGEVVVQLRMPDIAFRLTT